jgi:ABC-2 type transport system permease protein
MRAALQIALKDLLLGVRDRSALAIAIAAPLGLAFILSNLLGGAGDSSLDVRLAVVDRDAGPVAQAYLDDVLGALDRAGVATIRRADDPSAARALAREGEVAAAILLPPGLSEAVATGRPAEISLVTDPGSRVGAQIAASATRRFASEVNAIRLSVATALDPTGVPPDRRTLEELTQGARAIAPPAVLTTDRAADRQFDTKTFFAAGMAVFFLFFTASLAASSLLRERRQGTLARLVAAPLSGASIVLGKALYTFLLGLGSMAVLVLASRLLMGARWGQPLAVAVVVIAGVFAATGIQSLVTTLAQTDEQANGYGSIVAVTLGLLGGTFFPLSQAPDFLSRLSFITPHAWLMRGLGDLSGGGALADVVPAVLALVAFGAVTGSVGLVRARGLVMGR